DPRDRVETGNPVDVDEERRRCEAGLHHRDEALPTGQDAGVFAASSLGGDGFVQRAGSLELERGWEHAHSLPRCGPKGTNASNATPVYEPAGPRDWAPSSPVRA